MTRYCFLSTVLGTLTVISQQDKLVALLHEEEAAHLRQAFPDAEEKLDDPFLQQVVEQIEAFLAGDRVDFDLPIQPAGTEFQKQIWQSLQQVPYGETTSYADIAEHIGNENAVRAVGTACGANPLPLVIPCHRVTSRDGSLGGFRWGLTAKHKLLLLESGAADAMQAGVA